MSGSPGTEVGRLSGVPVERTRLDSAIGAFLARVRDGQTPNAYRLVNSYSLSLADKEPDYHRLLATRGVNLPDGKPLVVALNLLSRRGESFSQVRGPSFFVGSLERGRAQGIRHYFIGGSPETLKRMLNEADRRYPGLEIAGSFSPPFRPLTDEERREQDEQIKASGADIVWVGLGTPKQDFEAQRICERVGVSTAGVGAAFDFLAGTKREAPQLLSRLGLEWVFRLATEPKRLWKRYLFGNSRFLLLVVREAMRRR